MKRNEKISASNSCTLNLEIDCKVVYTLFMKSFDLALDIKRICAIYNVSLEAFSNAIGVSRTTLNDILKGKKPTLSKALLEAVNGYAYRVHEGIDINRSKEMIYQDDAHGRILLFHGARQDIAGEVDVHHSVPPNDFGDGFYTGTSLKQASSWVSKFEHASAYCFYLEKADELETLRLEAGRDWLYAVLFYRNAFADFSANDNVHSLIHTIEHSDLIIAPIANNEMFRTIDAFAHNEITDEACLHAISATNLGYQYVFKSDSACAHLRCIDRLYLCEKEKIHYLQERDALAKEGIMKSQLAKIEYRRKGLYFDEIFSRKG